MIECKKCEKQDISETKRTLRERFSKHKRATNNSLHVNATTVVPSPLNLPQWPLYNDSVAGMDLAT